MYLLIKGSGISQSV